MATTISNLSVDILTIIICAVAKSQNGAYDVVQSMIICPSFREASDGDVVHRSVSFQNVRILDRFHLFRSTKGLLYKCAKAGNPEAVHLLAQVIIASCATLVDRSINMPKEILKSQCCYDCPWYQNLHGRARFVASVASFVAHFIPAQEPIANSNPCFHWEFVKSFILKCTPDEIRNMGRHLCNYINLFHESPGIDYKVLSFKRYIVNMMRRNDTTIGYIVLLLANDTKIAREDLVPTIGDLVYSRRTKAIFEELRKKALDAFDALTPSLW